MGFMRRVISALTESTGQDKPMWGRQDHPTTVASEVVPALLDATWPVVAQKPRFDWQPAVERSALPYESTACPSCGATMAQPPESQPRTCRSCSAKVFVRVVERDRRRLATKAQAEAIDQANVEWEVAEQARLDREWYATLRPAGLLVADRPDEGASLYVAGESHYHADLAALMAAIRTDPEVRDVWLAARLVRDPANRYDSNAVRVEIHGKLVGYVSRDDAPSVQRSLIGLEGQGRPAFVLAHLGGGWMEDGFLGPIGVTLEDLPEEIYG